MNEDLTKITENAESKALDREKEQYPVQQIAVTDPISDKEVKDAVKELNPDTSNRSGMSWPNCSWNLLKLMFSICTACW